MQNKCCLYVSLEPFSILLAVALLVRDSRRFRSSNMVPPCFVWWKGAGWGCFQFPQLLCAWDANSAVASPAYLGPWTSVVGWSGVKIIWRGASGTPQGQERQVKLGPPSKPWPLRTQASPTAVPSLAGRHLGPLTEGSPRAGPPGWMGVPTGHHGPWQPGGQR